MVQDELAQQTKGKPPISKGKRRARNKVTSKHYSMLPKERPNSENSKNRPNNTHLSSCKFLTIPRKFISILSKIVV